MIAFLANPIAKYLAAALAAVLLFGGAYVKGRVDGRSIAEAKIEEQRHQWELKVQQAQAAADQQIATITSDADAKIAKYKAEIDRLKKQKPGTQVVERIVEVYIPQLVDAGIPKGFVDLHNTAADGESLSTTPKPDAVMTSDKKLSDVGSVVAQNYYQCNATAVQLEALQEVVKTFIKQQKELNK